MKWFRCLHLTTAALLLTSALGTCYAPPHGQSSPDSFLPLLLMWWWLSLIALAGTVPILVGRGVTRGSVVLLIVMALGAISAVVDYWIFGTILGWDIDRLNAAAETIHNIAYITTVGGCVAAPGALALALVDLRRFSTAPERSRR